MAIGEGAVRGGRRVLGVPSSMEKKRLKYTSKPSSLLSAPLEGIEKGCYTYVVSFTSKTVIITIPLLVNMHSSLQSPL